MKLTSKAPFSDELAQRKGDHIELAQRSRTNAGTVDERFNYEPMFFSHPNKDEIWESSFLKFKLNYPLWVSSMTGGTEHAKAINENLARLCGEYKLGMGLGSCRSLLEGDARFEEFAVRKLMGSQPLYANIGIAQLEELLDQNKESQLHEMVNRLEANGLIVHINPLQEWFQPEGDRYKKSPLETLKRFLEGVSYSIIVKEVGQGMGPKSLKALLELPIDAIEFGAYGGTNFSLLESLRATSDETKKQFIYLGHTAHEMVDILNALPTQNKEFIISGGVRNMLDGFELKSKLKANSLIGMASAFLGPALNDYENLQDYFLRAREALLTSKGLLELREEV